MEDRIFAELKLTKPKELLHTFDALAPFQEIILPGFTLKHYKGYSTILLTDINSKEYLLEFLLAILPFPEDMTHELYRSPYSSVVLDTSEYTTISLEYAAKAITALDIKLIWAENDIASHYYYWFSLSNNIPQEAIIHYTNN